MCWSIAALLTAFYIKLHDPFDDDGPLEFVGVRWLLTKKGCTCDLLSVYYAKYFIFVLFVD